MSSLSHNQQIGRVGEEIAARWVVDELGMHILERNWRKQHKELDIIAQDDNKLRIIEVKSRMESSEESINSSLDDKKLRNLVKGASLYISTFYMSGIDEIFFDLIVVIFADDGSYRVDYTPKFFYPQWGNR